MTGLLTIIVIVLSIGYLRLKKDVLETKKTIDIINRKIKVLEENKLTNPVDTNSVITNPVDTNSVYETTDSLENIESAETLKSYQKVSQKPIFYEEKNVVENLIQSNQEPISQEPISQESISQESISQEPINQEPIIDKSKKTKTIDFASFFSVESIISKLGILLLLIGVGFIYKLAYDNGYITPTLAVIFGYIIGLVVIGLAVKVRKKKRKVLSQVMFGGGVAILYIATFAAYLNYELFGSFIAFIILFTITFTSFFIAISIDSVAMSLVALIGGLITPFIVGIDYLGLYKIGLYLFALSAGSITIYYFKRWRSLQLSTIVLVNMITVLLCAKGGLSTKESFEFTTLLVILLVLFAGFEYMIFYLGKDVKSQIVITGLIISVLPLLTLVQVLSILDLPQTTWAFTFFGVALIFFLLNFMIYKKRDHSIVSDITLSYIGFFSLVAILLYFGGEVRFIVILLQSLIFMYISSKMNHLFTRIIGWIIYGIGFILSFSSLLESIIASETTLIVIIVRAITLLLLTFIALYHQDWKRKIMGGLAFQLYFILGFLSLIWEWTKQYDSSILLILAYGMVIWLFFILNKYLKLLSLTSIILYAFIPFLGQLVFSGVILYEDRIIWLNTLGFVIYSLNLYIISITVLKNTKQYIMGVLKIFAYLSLSSVLLVEISTWLGHFGYGLALYGCLTIGFDYIEKKELKVLKVFSHYLKLSFGFMFISYSLSSLYGEPFNIVYLIVDFIMLIIMYYIFSLYIKDKRLVLLSHMIVYMLVVYQNLSLEENGVITLLWAAYGIIGLAYFVTKGKRQLTYICLGLIIFVAGRFVLIDLSTIATIWKIVTSMAFGVALLILSYGIGPLIERFEDLDDR